METEEAIVWIRQHEQEILVKIERCTGFSWFEGEVG